MALVTKPADYLPAQEWLRQYEGVIGRHSFYKGIEDGSIPHVRLGRKILVRRDALELMAARQKSTQVGNADGQ